MGKVSDDHVDIAQQKEYFPIEQTIGHVEIPEHPHKTDISWHNILEYWWVLVIFLIGFAFTAKAIWRVVLKIPFVNEILSMWKKT